MIEQFVKVWKINHGNLLFGLALLAASLMSAVWYFNLIPEIQLIQGEPPVRRKGNSSQPMGPVYLQISGPSPSDSVDHVNGAVLIFTGEGELRESTTATNVHPFGLDASGNAFVMLSYSTQSSFAIVAYLDLNSNGKLDFNAGAPSEPWRSSLSPTATPRSLDLSDAAVTTTQSMPLELRFDFSRGDDETVADEKVRRAPAANAKD